MQLFVTFAETCLILPMDSQSSHVAFLSYVPRAHRAMVHSRPLCHFSANQPSYTAHFEQITRNSLACPSHRKSLQCLDRQKVEARIFGSYLWWRIVMIIMRLVVLIPFIPCVYPVVVLWLPWPILFMPPVHLALHLHLPSKRCIPLFIYVSHAPGCQSLESASVRIVALHQEDIHFHCCAGMLNYPCPRMTSQ